MVRLGVAVDRDGVILVSRELVNAFGNVGDFCRQFPIIDVLRFHVLPWLVKEAGRGAGKFADALPSRDTN